MNNLELLEELRDFIEECIVWDEDLSVCVSELFYAYWQWGGEMERTNFYREFARCSGIRSVPKNINKLTTRVYRGIAIKGTNEPDTTAKI